MDNEEYTKFIGQLDQFQAMMADIIVGYYQSLLDKSQNNHEFALALTLDFQKHWLNQFMNPHNPEQE